MSARSRETILAQATPPGEGGLAVVRLSGPKAIAAVDRVFRGKRSLRRAASHTISYGFIVHSVTRERIDEVLVSVFRSPTSYTGEDAVEVSGHGGRAAVGAIIRQLLATGLVRPAEPGEFTRRAVLNGRLDLAQAEAIPELVHAKSDLARKRAIAQLTGVFSNHIEQLRVRLTEVQTLLTAQLEFGDELPKSRKISVDRVVDEIRTDVDRLVIQAEVSPLLSRGALIVIIGKPNVGKSSLFNRLLDEDRAIVTDAPGTTRDCLEAELDIGGMVIRLVDTAGWRVRSGRIEALGKARTARYLERADALLTVLDSSAPLTAEDREVIDATDGRRRIFVLNKSDLRRRTPVAMKSSGMARVRVSARNGTGIGSLRRAIANLFGTGSVDADFIASQRQQTALRQAAQALKAAAETTSFDARLAEVGSAIDALQELLGRVTCDEILDRVFRQFCIGK